MNRISISAALAIASCLFVAGNADAIAPGYGQLRAVSSGATVAPGSEVAITPDASDGIVGSDPSYVAAREAAAEALRALGMRVVDRAPLTLKLQVDAPHFAGARKEDELASAHISSDSTAGPGPARKPRVSTHVELAFEPEESAVQPGLSLAFVLFDQRGSPLWTASFQAAGATDDAEKMIRRMVRASIASLGAGVDRRYVLACDKDQANGAGTDLCLP